MFISGSTQELQWCYTALEPLACVQNFGTCNESSRADVTQALRAIRQNVWDPLVYVIALLSDVPVTSRWHLTT